MIAEEKYDLPPTYKLMLKWFFPGGKLKVLDLGCGSGVVGQILNSNKQHEFVGVDIYEPYLKICRQKGYYQRLEKTDITKMIMKDKSFDVVLLLQVVEHLDKKTGENLIRKAIKAARKCIIVSVPNGHCQQEEYDGNIHHKHISSWNVSNLRKLGFKVYGQGLKVLFGSKSYGAGKGANWWQKITVPLSTILLPVIMIFPQLAVQLIGVYYPEDTKRKRL